MKILLQVKDQVREEEANSMYKSKRLTFIKTHFMTNEYEEGGLLLLSLCSILYG